MTSQAYVQILMLNLLDNSQIVGNTLTNCERSIILTIKLDKST